MPLISPSCSVGSSGFFDGAQLPWEAGLANEKRTQGRAHTAPMALDCVLHSLEDVLAEHRDAVAVEANPVTPRL